MTKQVQSPLSVDEGRAATIVARLREGQHGNDDYGEDMIRAAGLIESLSHQLTEALKDRDYYANRYADKCGETIVLTAKIEEAAKVAEKWPGAGWQVAKAIRALAKGG